MLSLIAAGMCTVQFNTIATDERSLECDGDIGTHKLNKALPNVLSVDPAAPQKIAPQLAGPGA